MNDNIGIHVWNAKAILGPSMAYIIGRAESLARELVVRGSRKAYVIPSHEFLPGKMPR